MEIVTVKFSDVGARKLTWTDKFPRPLTHHSLVKSVKKHHALGSRDIEFDDNGGIYVGGFRRVGSWDVVQ